MSQEYRMLSVEDALHLVLAQVHPLDPERVPILDALGRVLAEDVYADTDIPPLSNSAMDGYALQAGDTLDADPQNPARLRVIHDLPAGYTTDLEVTTGTAIRIMTGAPVPPGADTVIPFEQVERDGDWVTVPHPYAVGKNVRPAGEDVRRGQLVLREGTVVRPQEVGMLAALGRREALAIRRPRVGILATGDEVVAIDAPLNPGKIRNANSYSNAAQVIKYGGVPVLLGIARDDVGEITARLREVLERGIDLLLTSGGISAGDFDLVKEVLATEGEMSFWQVRMRPGKPLAFGRIGGVPLIGLPGNPVSAMVSFELFARPAILQMLGREDLTKPTVQATLAEDVKTRAGFRHFLRVVLEKEDGRYLAHLTGGQGSGILLSMVRAHGLAVIPEAEAGLRAGSTVQVMLLD
ncbi:MAG: molybdopterin molybdotransferase MoeA [Anaerolineales bacterium]|nr:MAG: molybdopterin molybdotransferase MoeA [Anaerolineales bacterium]